ncbi:MAG: type IV toxin-antitoxin system AbiEi family antitoxin domain-containing protein, partial [Solirubrobacterales bacterium]
MSPAAWRLDQPMVEELANTTDARVARLAAAQHGVVTTAQLRELGLSVQAVSKRTQRGHLHRVHRGVYAVGHAGLSPHGCWMAAVLAVGPDAVLSHRAAAALWSLLPIGAGVVDATVATVGGRAKRRGIRIHRSRTLTPADRTLRHNIRHHADAHPPRSGARRSSGGARPRPPSGRVPRPTPE